MTNIQHSRRRLLGTLACGTLLGLRPGYAAERFVPYSERPDVLEWTDQLTAQTGISRSWICNALDTAQYNATIERLMTPDSAQVKKIRPKNWYVRKASVLTSERITKGRAFMDKYKTSLQQAHKRWGVPPEIVTAVIGVESIYGKSMGRFRVIDTLCTLSFDYTRRASFYRSELAAFLCWAHKSEMRVKYVYGSYAGAVGMCQFMPSNVLKLGIDFDNNGIVDLIHSAPDAIASVAHYLHNSGWQAGLPMAWDCLATPAIAESLKSGGIRPNTTVSKAKERGVHLITSDHPRDSEPVLLVDLPFIDESGEKGCLWRLGSRNFAAVLDYNRSYFYAESIRVLAEAIVSDDQNSSWIYPFVDRSPSAD